MSTAEADLNRVFDLEPEALRCPYPILDRLREEQPVVFVPEIDCWIVSRFDDIVFVGRHPELFSSRSPTGPVLVRQQAEAFHTLIADEPELASGLGRLRGGGRVLLTADPPDHA